jgi:hypothetical protein
MREFLFQILLFVASVLTAFVIPLLKQHWLRRMAWLSVAVGIAISLFWGGYELGVRQPLGVGREVPEVYLKKTQNDPEAPMASLNRTQAAQDDASIKLTRLDALEKENLQLKVQIEDLNKGNIKALRDNKLLESRNVNLKTSNDALIKPRTKSSTLNTLKSREIGPNQLLSYLDGAVTVHASYIKENGACLMTNFDNECKFTEVGKLLPFRVGDKKYAFRVDGTSMWIRDDPTHADNIVKITILFLGSG